MQTLVIGYGNPGRRDDGLGPSFADILAAEGIPGVDVDSDYQLTVEVTNVETAEVMVKKQRDRLRRASRPLIGW